MKLNAEQLRTVKKETLNQILNKMNRNPVYLILENIYDTYNVGGLFRLADGIAAEKVYLCGATETPPNSRIHKASIGTYKTVPWEYKNTAVEVIETLKDNYCKKQPKKSELLTIAVEQSETSVPYNEIDYSQSVAIILGNETFGVTKETLGIVDKIAEIPMWGINKSLNVIVSAGIVSYEIMSRRRESNP